MASDWVAGSPPADRATPEVIALADHPDLVRLSNALQAPQAALRARLNAIVLDLILLGLVSQALSSAVEQHPSGGTRTLVFLAVEFVYFFVLELRWGRTVGKRVFHVRVITTSGVAPTARQIALRNVLRIADALPLLYASGLISLTKTGPGRRQRIGDVAADTTVVLDADGVQLATPGWLLPALTVLSTCVSLLLVFAILSSLRTTAGTGAAAPAEAPATGAWLGRATLISSVGYGNEVGPTLRWTIARSCPPYGRCGLTLTDEPAGEPPVSGTLLPARGGWVVAFPPRTFPCGEAAGHTLYWQQHTLITLRFTDRGRRAEGEEGNLSRSQACGYGTDRRHWTAELRTAG